MVVAATLMTAVCVTRAPVYTPSADVTTPVLVTERKRDYTEEAMHAKIQGSARNARARLTVAREPLGGMRSLATTS